MRLRGNRALLQRLGNSYYSSIFPKDYLTQKTSSLSNGCVEEMLNYSSQGSVPVSPSAICLMTLLLRLLWVYLILVQTRRLNARELVLSEGRYLKLNLDAEKASKYARLPERPSQFFFFNLRFASASAHHWQETGWRVFFFSYFPSEVGRVASVSSP